MKFPIFFPLHAEKLTLECQEILFVNMKVVSPLNKCKFPQISHSEFFFTRVANNQGTVTPPGVLTPQKYYESVKS